MSSQSGPTGLTTSGVAFPPWIKRWLTRLSFSLAPLLIALLITGSLLLVMGVNPLEYYSYIVRKGLLTPSGLDATLTRMGPLLLIAASLIVAFRAGLWNLGGDGQFLLGAVTSSALAPALLAWGAPVWLALLLAMLAAAVVGGVWALLPGLLKAWQNINEIITTMMMSFLGISLANVLVKLVFFDPSTTVPQTRTLPWEDRLPMLFGSHISSGLLLGLLAILAVHWMMTRTAFGLQLRVVGANPQAAIHAGISVSLLTLAVFALSAALAGLAGAVEIMGVQGNVRADWNPAYGLVVVPLVFLARFNGFGTIAFVFLFSMLSIGSESAARRMDIPNHFTLVTVAVLMLVLGLTECVEQRQRQKVRG
ncbi:simple sugar transport system permease protein [Erwinia toletana]|uniref:Simple sugar transport system permease protein n=1 Tax=Winslowiella toletana TaxID=92490 RepID=A0ABS4PD55_9GAMM|nr:ABC transporter permease [Winslowiella toletana]MBP2170021.1 simple sugar transport system permease protein [Winslowiella toletana]